MLTFITKELWTKAHYIASATLSFVVPGLDLYFFTNDIYHDTILTIKDIPLCYYITHFDDDKIVYISQCKANTTLYIIIVRFPN
jgi:hypothetical protein